MKSNFNDVPVWIKNACKELSNKIQDQETEIDKLKPDMVIQNANIDRTLSSLNDRLKSMNDSCSKKFSTIESQVSHSLRTFNELLSTASSDLNSYFESELKKMNESFSSKISTLQSQFSAVNEISEQNPACTTVINIDSVADLNPWLGNGSSLYIGRKNDGLICLVPSGQIRSSLVMVTLSRTV